MNRLAVDEELNASEEDATFREWNSFSDEERLALLREGDRYRRWRSLDDRRVCIRCARVFSGREVVLVSTGDGRSELRCPTGDCDALPLHWLFCGRGERTTQIQSA